MFRHAIYTFAFVLSFTAAQAEKAENYFSVSGVIDATLDYDSESLFDVSIDSGFILSYGLKATDMSAFEVAYIRYIDTSSFGGEVAAEVTAVEFSGLFKAGDTGPFLRLGLSDGDLSSRVGSAVLNESERGALIGFGIDMPIANNKGAIRFEYTTIGYDNADADRLSVGTLVRF